MAMVTPSQIIAAIPVHKNLDEAYLDRIIEPTQLSELRPVCPEFYDYMIENNWLVDGVVNPSLNAVESKLLTDYLAPFLHWQCGVESIPTIRTSVANNGLFSAVPTQTTVANPSQAHGLEDTLQSTASMYKTNMVKYIEDNEDTFTVYADNCKCKKHNNVFKNFGIV